jgi:hypothetical protein
MQATTFKRKALTSFFVAGWVAFFSAAIAHAQPLYANPPPPQPPPTFNPSTPYTVPQSPQTPVSPGLPNVPPGSSAAVSPSVRSPPRAVARSHRWRATVTGTSNVTEDEPWAGVEHTLHTLTMSLKTRDGVCVSNWRRFPHDAVSEKRIELRII